MKGVLCLCGQKGPGAARNNIKMMFEKGEDVKQPAEHSSPGSE